MLAFRMILNAPLRLALLGGAGLLPFLAFGQTLSISNGVHKYTALTNTAVTMNGRCELWVTSTNTPISGCTINLNSADTFLILPGIRPSAVVSTYLTQLRINGTAAVSDGNCRVVQYAMGGVVVPHAPSLQPLQVFSGPYYTGASRQFSHGVYYQGASLGAFDKNIRSFKLRRGYVATLAQFEGGTGVSRNYVAQDGDMEVTMLPGELGNGARFVYVLPWRWVSKKGIASDPGIGLINVRWMYNWNIDRNSSRDLEYVPIRQNQFWPSLNQNWLSRGANTLLGYNEPDRPDQANMPVATAISAWPDLLGTGLRVGAPAVSDGGRDGWLYPFIDQANAADLRVDFVPVHYYWCFNPADASGAANQMYNFLKATYDRVKRPLWVTEWNNGANWTGCADPTYTQQGACINAMIDMMDNTPFVERYALYNWVETVRYVVTNGVVTPAGAAYRDQNSPIGYVQAMQDNETRSFAQFRFENDTLDSSGYGNNGIVSGSPAYTNGYREQALAFDGTNTVVALPPNVARGSSFTFAAWVNWGGGGNWQRIFDFGNSTTHYMFLTPRSGAGTLRFAIKNGGSEQIVETGVMPIGQWRHVAITLSGNTARLYVNGAQVAVNTNMSITPASFRSVVNYLGKSQFPADPAFRGLIDEVLITDYALSAAEIAGLRTNTPPQFTGSFLAMGSIREGQSYSNSLAGAAADADPGDTLTYVKTSGPAWLNVADDGTLTGRPTGAHLGTNYFVVRVTDAARQSDFAVVAINVVGASGVWIADASASWGNTNAWSSNIVATGVSETADFSAINITADRTVVLDRSRHIGVLKFADTLGADSWTVASAPGSVLTLDNGLAGFPSILVSNTVTISAPIAGTSGFIKSGPGALIFAGNNSYTGGVIVNGGILLMNGTNTSATAVEARNRTLLGGSGFLPPVTIWPGGELSPGPQWNATLTTEGLVLASGSTLTIDLDIPGDQVVVNGDVVLNGRLNVRPSGTVVNGAYTIIRYTGTRSGSGLILTNVPAGYSMMLDYVTPGEVRVIVAGGLDRFPLVSAGAVWKYNAAGGDLGTAWRTGSFHDAAWPSGPAQVGYGDDDEATPIDISGGKPQILYFRRSFRLTAADIGTLSNCVLSLLRDDGAVVYLNGAEVRRDNMPAAPAVIAYDTRAVVAVVNADENTYFNSALDPSLFVVGTNVLAVEVHQEDPTSTDLSFDLKLDGVVQGSNRPGRLVPVTLVAGGARWKYFAQANDLGSAWRSNSFDDSSWSSGVSMLGFGDANGILPATVIASNRQWTTYFRRSIYVPEPSQVKTLTGRILRDDGAVVYLNGAEVWRDPNLPGTGTINYNTPADALGGADESAWLTFSLNPAALQAGTNVIAIEVHQSAVDSSDLAMNFEMSGVLLLPLDIQLSISGNTLSWPGEGGWFAVFTTTNLTPPVIWRPATNSAVLSDESWQMTLPDVTSGHKYFKLHY